MPRVLDKPKRVVTSDWPAIPGFRINRVIDQGGMGVVYLAEQEAPERQVALKVIRPDRRANPEAVKRFEREAKAAARLTHPNVVSVYHAGRAGSLHYIAMEYVEGTDLARLVHRQGPLPPAQAIDYLRQAALGLQHLLDCGLVHRDIKPSNLLVCPSSGATGNGPPDHGRIKIVDLGLAKHLRPGEDSTITQGGMVGTPDFMAPEQVENPHQADVRADLYSLGCTLYCLLTGRPPFPDGSMIHKLDMHRWGTPAPLDRLRGDVPPELAVIAARLLAKKPAERFQSPAELAEALRPLAGAAAAASTLVLQPARTRVDDRASTFARPKAKEAVVWLRGHTAAVTSVAFSADGLRLLSGSLDESARLWGLAAGREIRIDPGHPGGVTAVAFAGRHVLSAGRDCKLRLRDGDSGQDLLVLEGHKGEVHGLAVSADGRRAVSASQDQTVRCWDLKKGKEVRRLGGTVTERHWDNVLCVAMQDGFALSGGRDGTARLWDLASGRQRRCWRDHYAAVMAVDLTGDAALSAAGHTIRLWDVVSGELRRTLAGHTQPILTACFAAAGSRVVSGGQDGSVRIWDVATGEEVQRCEGQSGWVLSARLAPDGQAVLAGGADGSVAVWPIVDGSSGCNSAI